MPEDAEIVCVLGMELSLIMIVKEGNGGQGVYHSMVIVSILEDECRWAKQESLR